MAIPISEGNRPSIRTDLEELVYTLLFLMRKRLPWTHVKDKTHIEVCRKNECYKKI